MSNEPEKTEGLPKEIEDSIFVGLDTSAQVLDKDTVEALTDKAIENEVKVDLPQAKPTPKWMPPKIPVRAKVAEETSKQVAANVTSEKEKQTDTERIAALEAVLRDLLSRQGISLEAAPQVPQDVDFSKLTEADVFDLNTYIPTVDHSAPDYTKIVLKDTTYIGRWVSTHPARLGLMKSCGFRPVHDEDLAEPLEMAIEPDENGMFKFIDVIAMMGPKDKYLGALRKNYIRALKQTNSALIHQQAAQVTERAIMEGTQYPHSDVSSNPNIAMQPDPGQSREYNLRKSKKQMGIYSPNL